MLNIKGMHSQEAKEQLEDTSFFDYAPELGVRKAKALQFEERSKSVIDPKKARPIDEDLYLMHKKRFSNQATAYNKGLASITANENRSASVQPVWKRQFPALGKVTHLKEHK